MSAPLKVLIAEDDPITSEMLEFLVKEEGHSVCGIITQGSEVVRAVERLMPDVVLMDVHLADETTGITATRELLAKVMVPVVIISSTDCPEDLREISESGALGFIKKPISAEELHVNMRIVTNHTEIIRQLKRSELMHRSIFDDAAVGIYVCHKDGYYMASNYAFANMLGYAGPGELLRLVHSVDDQIYVKEGLRDFFLKKLAAGEILSDIESQVYGKDGDVLWVSEHIAPHYDDNGAVMHYEGVVVDISDKKQAENERNIAHSLIQITMDSIHDYVAVVDLDGSIIFANKSFERDLGTAVGEQRTINFRSSENCPFRRFQSFVKENRVTDSEFQVRGYCTIDKHPDTLSIGITPFLTEQGELLGAVLLMHAVTDGEQDEVSVM